MPNTETRKRRTQQATSSGGNRSVDAMPIGYSLINSTEDCGVRDLIA
jgi:hypothetical protein